MKNPSFIICLLINFFLFNACSNTKSNKESPIHIKVLSYNIHHANPPSKENVIDLYSIAKVINESKADIVGLQELDVNTTRSGIDLDQAAVLGKLTGMQHYFAKGIDYQGGEYGIAILSRFPILKSEMLVLPMKEGAGGEPRVMAVITIEPLKGKQLVFANTHLDLKAENRILQASAIVDYFEKFQSPLIFCGDLNTTPVSEAIKIFEAHLTRSSIPNGFTFPQINPNREIDYIMYKPKNRFRIINHKIIDEFYASDHLPLFVEFELN